MGVKAIQHLLLNRLCCHIPWSAASAAPCLLLFCVHFNCSNLIAIPFHQFSCFFPLFPLFSFPPFPLIILFPTVVTAKNSSALFLSERPRYANSLKISKRSFLLCAIDMQLLKKILLD
ncbi:MAG: hypothetical protein JOS17DRAFT_738441 [Linnemannia elongata]|nr:MAG: hypothetical protein JOS17DRAFT_738441 [Linnemannia elongata]